MVIETTLAVDGIVLIIDGREQRFPVAHSDTESPTIGVSHVGAFPAKQVIGDWTKTSHFINSSFVQTSWLGGGQINESQEATDIDRYASIASLETRFANSLTLLPKANKIIGPNTNRVQMLGDLVVSGQRRTYVAYGAEMRRIEGTTLTTPHTLAGIPVHEGAVFRVAGVSKMFIPIPELGYQTWDGTTLSGLITTIKPLNFAVHSRKLWAVDKNGVVWKSLDGTTWISTWEVDPAHIVRGVITYMDRSEAPALHVISDDWVLSLDEGVPAMYETDLFYPPHRMSAASWERWRTDLYVSIGMGLMRYTLGTINAAGLDRDDGVGPEYAGYISQLERSFNDLFAGVTAFTLPSEVEEEFRADYGIEVYLAGRDATCSVMRQNGGGAWHTAAVMPSPGGEITTLMVCSQGDTYRVYWGWNGDLYFQELSLEFDNPKHNPTQQFESFGALVSPWLDFGMSVDRMTLAAIESRIKLASPENVVAIDYQIDNDDATQTWRSLVEITTPGYHVMRVGENGVFPTVQESQTRYDGVGFGRFRYRISMRSTNGKTPDLESLVVTFIKNMRRLRSFEVQIDCSLDDEANEALGMGNEERRRTLQRLIDAETFIPFLYKNEWIMTKMSYANGPEGISVDSTGDLTITLLESWEQPRHA